MAVFLDLNSTASSAQFPAIFDFDMDLENFDILSDDETPFPNKCSQAQVIRFLRPGMPSIVELVKNDRPVFTNANRLILRRPMEKAIETPFRSPRRIEPSVRDSRSSSIGKRSISSTGSHDSVDSIPSLYLARSASPMSDQCPSTPTTPDSFTEGDDKAMTHEKEDIVDHASENLHSKIMDNTRLNKFTGRPGSDSVGRPMPCLPTLDTSRTYQLGSTPASSPGYPSIRDRILLASKTPIVDSHSHPMSARPIPSKSIWRDTARTGFGHKILRRVESRIGLNVH